MTYKKSEYVLKKRLEEEVRKMNRDLDAVIVEGFEDKLMIRKLGFQGRIYLSAEKTVEDLVEDVSRGSERVAILTDFDEHGKEANKELRKALEEEVDILNSIRRDFGKILTESGRRDIEDIRTLFTSKEKKFVEAALDGLYF